LPTYSRSVFYSIKGLLIKNLLNVLTSHPLSTIQRYHEGLVASIPIDTNMDEPLRLGSTAPNFEADTTQGYIDFYNYIGNKWALLLCYPDDFTPVATTELVIFAHLQKEFAKRNVKLLVISTENRPIDGKYVPHEDWIQDVNDIGPVPMEFPIVRDTKGEISKLYHVLDEEDVENLNADDEVTTGLAFNSRTIYIIGPAFESQHHIRMILQYPATVGFNTGEVLRIIDALQLSDSAGVRMPANWAPGSDAVVHPSMGDDEAIRLFPNFKAVKSYLRFVEMPAKNINVQQMFFRGGDLTSFGTRVEDGVLKIGKGTVDVAVDTLT